MDSIVLDASVAMTWCYPDENARYAYSVLDALENVSAVVPSLWPVEVANAVIVGERRHHLSAADVTRFFELLRNLSIVIDSQTGIRSFSETMALARTYGLSAYDAVYLELAMRENLTLATLDEQLKKAANASGVTIFS